MSFFKKNDFLLDGNIKQFIKFNISRWVCRSNNSKTSEILIEVDNMPESVIPFSFFGNILANIYNANLISFSISQRNQYLFSIRYRRLFNIYKSFGVLRYVNTKLIGMKISKKMADKLILNLRCKEDLLGMVIDGCPIGNDIYESYLMTYRHPTLELKSKNFRTHLAECLAIFFYWKNYFDLHEVKSVLMSHGIYKFGIISKIAMKLNVPVYILHARNMYYLSNFNLGCPNFSEYPLRFKALPEDIRSKGLIWAKSRIDLRMSGEISVDMHYSTKSAFGVNKIGSKVLKGGDRFKVLIAAHCFFDNPNAYGRNIFPDFYEWLMFLGEISNQTDYDWYIKTHPDVLPGNEDVVRKILQAFPRIILLPPETTHHQLIDDGISAVLTVYGSVGHEYPYLGKLVVNAGANPHVGYGFNVHPKTREEYKQTLLNLDKLHLEIDVNEIFEFYFMHNKYNVCDALFFPSYSNFLSSLKSSDRASSKAYKYFMDHYSIEHDEVLCKKIDRFIKSKDLKYYDDPSSLF